MEGEREGYRKESSRVRSLRRRIADMARGSGLGEVERRWASLRERVSGWLCLQRLKRVSASERVSLEVDIRWEIMVSNGVGSGPRMAAI